MRDREFVNRFCAFQILALDSYKGDMDEFLAQGLRRMNAMAEADLSRLSTEFRTSLANNYKVFGEHAFRKHTSDHARRSIINASLWDVMSTGLSRFPEHLIEARKDSLRDGFFRLMRDEEFIKAITYGPNDAKKVRRRFEMAQAMLAEVFGAHAA